MVKKMAGTPVKSALDKMKDRAIAAKASSVQTTNEQEIIVPLDKIRFDPKQPRQAFHTLDGRVAEKDEQYIDELAASIKESELIQAITVREGEDGTYIVVVGECRTRAHLKLGLPTIRAIVRNDLTNPALRLLYQLTENVQRKDLTDQELSLSIRKLMKGDKENGVPPMTQVQIATKLGKADKKLSEGWITRLVKFGDKELQRVWFKTGIADTAENLYRLSILPSTLQMNIIRRVELPENDSERLEKPLSRKVIDEFSQLAKMEKVRVKTLATTPAEPATALPASNKEIQKGGGVAGNDVVDLALQKALEESSKHQGAGSSASGNKPDAGKYVLPEAARTEILGGVAAVNQAHVVSSELSLPPVSCRVALSNLEGLLAILQKDEEMLDSARSIRCEIVIPNALAKLLANKLVGMIVDEQEISSRMQIELTKLG